MIRYFDIIFSICGLLLLFPLLIVVYLVIKFESSGPSIFRQARVGKDGKIFSICKFRSMRESNNTNKKLVTVAGDPRITRSGHFIRKTKIDELPQLWNVLCGEMSLVGPRPEVAKYVALYSENQREILSIPPGITDLASLVFVDEERVLAEKEDSETFYRETVLPEKIRLNLFYVKNRSLKNYFLTLWWTMKKIVYRNNKISIPSTNPLKHCSLT